MILLFLAAYLSSDEDSEDPTALLYLPVAPEVEEPEELPDYGANGRPNHD